jgi:hypothetical protein
VRSEMSTPVMRSVYADAPLEDDEQFAVEGYLADLARDGAVSRKDCDFADGRAIYRTGRSRNGRRRNPCPPGEPETHRGEVTGAMCS